MNNNRQIKQDALLAFLTDNMKEMETELRAQSIVLEALAQRVIVADDLEQALTLARSSTSMLEFVQAKYEMIDELCSIRPALQTAKDVLDWQEPRAVGKLPN